MAPTRRRFVQASAAALLAAPWLAGSRGRHGGSGTGLRTDLATPAGAAALRALEEAVARLRALPTEDPRSWLSHVVRHRNFCPHANWWLLPWHRAFVHYFEACCADVLAMPGFRLPYWDWSRQRRIPPAFAGAGGPLFHGNRTARPVDALPLKAVGRATLSPLLASPLQAAIYGGATVGEEQDEVSFAGAFETAPHNTVHQFAGGDMATMLSPLDPLFWVHHANVDRIWASWMRLHGDAVPEDPRWGAMPMAQFHDPVSGARVLPRAAEVALSPDFAIGYDRYELPLHRAAGARPPRDAARLDLATAPDLPRALARGDADGVARPRLGLAFAPDAVVDGARGAMRGDAAVAALLVLEGLRPSPATQAMRVLAGDAAEPVATVAFFGGAGQAGHAGHAAGAARGHDGTTSVAIDIAPALSGGSPGAPLAITLEPAALDGSPARDCVSLSLRQASLVLLR